MAITIALDSLKIYENLKKVFGESEAKTITKVMTETIGKSFEEYQGEQNNFLATKKDIHKLEKKIVENKAEIIKWMFLFYVGQVATILAVLFIFFK